MRNTKLLIALLILQGFCLWGLIRLNNKFDSMHEHPAKNQEPMIGINPIHDMTSYDLQKYATEQHMKTCPLLNHGDRK
jgi:3'-phosphoadenosine 5'-phosphosulfate sulfotransferase (PAPS reductase)/FAD synthetase